MDVGFAARVVVVATAVVLAFALLAFGPSAAPRRAARAYRSRGRRSRLIPANLMSYVAASMAVALGSAVAVTH